VVLPGVTFAEKEGTFTNTERKVKRVRRAIEPIADARDDWWIIGEVSTRMGYDMRYESPERIMEELASVTPSYGGITYERIDHDGLQWPCPAQDHPGTKFLHKDKFARGKGLFHAIEYVPPDELPDEEYPLVLTTGRMFAHFHTGSMTRRSAHLHREVEEAYGEISPRDAEALAVREDDKIRVTSRRGSIEVAARVTDRIAEGTLFIPFHFVEGAANALTNVALDPVAKIPEYKVCAVRVEKAG